MSLWSKIKNVAKKAWRFVKAVVRVVVRVVITIVNNLTLGLPDLLLGFIAWPPKRLRLHVFILSAEPPPGGGDVSPSTQVVPTQLVQDAIDRTKKIYKERFNVNVRPYSKTFIEVITEPATAEALGASRSTSRISGRRSTRARRPRSTRSFLRAWKAGSTRRPRPRTCSFPPRPTPA